MNYKKILLIFLLLLVVFSTVGAASAGWFDSSDSKKDSKLTIHSNVHKTRGDYIIVVKAELADNEIYEPEDGRGFENETIYVNLTDENGHTECYNLSATSIGEVAIVNLTYQNYIVSAYFAGNDKYNPSNATLNNTLDGFDSGYEEFINEHSDSNSNNKNTGSSSSNSGFTFENCNGNKVTLDSEGKVKS